MKSRRAVVLAVILIVAVLSGCGERNGAGSVPGEQTIQRLPLNTGKLVIGYRTNGALSALKVKGELERKLSSYPVKVEWRAFPDDAALFKAIQEGSADIGGVGDSVAGFLHNKSAPVVYLAAEPANPEAHAVVVPLDSDIVAAADLKGRKVAYTAWSNEHFLLLQTLDKSGLSLSDVTSVQMQPGDLPRSFENGDADAWVVAEPELSRIEPAGIRIVADGNGNIGQREIYVTTPENVRERRDLLDIVLTEIASLDDWITNDVHSAAELLAANTDVSHLEWLALFERKAYGTAPFLEGIAREEQRLVDTLAQLAGRKERFFVKDLLLQADP
ncbi:ABC transporter substrate-binding protein [Paenibacillus beijingensis]|uniref:Solute-binding protein family 3/N-terminal domain-containing protein n=1 Tax=Paenibacillus beijingensis TaxID=1126833 RepID=A0A0D5NPP5_9BACL|nr:ABC transporter substrate-binding protein [Paenibacillus beijingensis]AJY76903.1 hypothetical protein VN24_22995 [Paenibacillus beijingensis]